MAFKMLSFAVWGARSSAWAGGSSRSPTHRSLTGRASHLHAADLEAEGGLRGGRVLGLAALYVALLRPLVPRLVAHLDVDDGGPVVLLRHILQLQQRPPSQVDHAICSRACQLFGGAEEERRGTEHAVV